MRPYRAVAAADLATREHAGIRVVYDRRAGLTHILSPEASSILDMLGDGPKTADELLAALAATYDLVAEDGGDLRQHVLARLAELTDLSLVDQP